jgi:small conductance mechanosensitive channel
MDAFWASNSHVVLSVAGALAVVAGCYVLALLLRRATERFLRRKEQSVDAAAITRLRMLQRLTTVVIMVVGGAIALYIVDIPGVRRAAIGVFASAGIAGLALAFAAQTTTANLISGIMISFVQPLRLGDRVEVDSDYGQVEEIGLFYTFIRTWDNKRVVIPNQILSNHVVRNFTVKDPRTPAVVNLRMAYGMDVGRLRALLLDLARSEPYFVDDPEPTVQVTAMDDSGINVRLVAWGSNAPEAWDFAAVLREEALKRLAEAGFERGSYQVLLTGPGDPAARPTVSPPA